ncbi:unnamed protein product, partial [Musa textilis]
VYDSGILRPRYEAWAVCGRGIRLGHSMTEVYGLGSLRSRYTTRAFYDRGIRFGQSAVE